LITTDAAYTGPDLDLTGYDNGSYNFTFGPVTVGAFTFTAAPGGGGNSGNGSVVGQGNYGLGSNGTYDLPAVYIGVDSGSGYADLLGTTAYSQMGFFFNYCPGCGDAPTISTLDAGGAVIDSWDLSTLAPISTPGGFNEFAFRGVTHDTADIYGLRFGGSYILASGTATGDVVTSGGIPEPATWAVMLVGFAGLGSALRRRRAMIAA
jgi:hypothetical protein